METNDIKTVTVEATIAAPVEKVWEIWASPEHITKWNNANEDWHTPYAENDLRTGGKFLARMEAKDGSLGFDFEGVYESVKPNEHIEYVIRDGRKVRIDFMGKGNETKVVETFDLENEYPEEQQRSGWQSILDNFKSYTEAHK